MDSPFARFSIELILSNFLSKIVTRFSSSLVVNNLLKKDLFQEFSIMGHVFQNFSKKIDEQDNEKKILEHYVRNRNRRYR